MAQSPSTPASRSCRSRPARRPPGGTHGVGDREQPGERRDRGRDLGDVVPADRVKRVCADEGAVAAGAEWLTEFWANRRTRGWLLAQTPLLHVYGHYFEARVAAGLWGARSP